MRPLPQHKPAPRPWGWAPLRETWQAVSQGLRPLSHLLLAPPGMFSWAEVDNKA